MTGCWKQETKGGGSKAVETFLTTPAWIPACARMTMMSMTNATPVETGVQATDFLIYDLKPLKRAPAARSGNR